MKTAFKKLSGKTSVILLLFSLTTLAFAGNKGFASFDFPLPGVSDTEATAITPSGVIVGRYSTPDGRQHGFQLKDGNFTSIDGPQAAYYTDVTWINARGDIVGTYSTDRSHAFVLSRGTYTTIDYPRDTPVNTLGFGVSNAGDVVGVVFVGSDFNHGHGYLFSHSQFTQLDFPGAAGTFPTMALNSNYIVGAYFDQNSTYHGFLLRNGKYSAIDFPDSTFTWITGISPQGDIVGFYNSKDTKQHGFVLQDDRFISIDVPVPGAVSTEVNGIDPQGDVVGRYVTADGKTHGYFLPKHQNATGAKPPTSATFSAAGDFSPTVNPNGAWSYGWSSTLGSTFNLFTISGTTTFSGEVGWFGPFPPTFNAPGYPLVVSTPNLPAQLLDMGPGPGGQYTVVRWTAPSTGTWDVVGQFQGLAPGLTSSDAHVLLNGSSLYGNVVNSTDSQPFASTVRVSMGDTIDFAVGYGPDKIFDFDSTGLTAVISPHLYDVTAFDFPGATDTRAFGINDRGDIVGWYADAIGISHGFLLRNGSFTSIDFPNSVLTQARGINNVGEIVGLYDEASTLPFGFEHGFVLHGAQFTRFDFPGATDTDILGINKQGDFAGAYDVANIAASIGFLTTGGQSTSFEVPGSAPDTTGAFGINALRQVVGVFTDSADPNLTRGFLRQGNNFTSIDFPGADSTLPTGINDAADIVGNCFCLDGFTHGFLVSKGNFTVVDVPAVSSRTRARGINNSGQIVGFYRSNSGTFRGFIATPVR